MLFHISSAEPDMLKNNLGQAYTQRLMGPQLDAYGEGEEAPPSTR